MNDLHVECYDEKEVVSKKQSIKKTMAIAGSVIVISAGLTSFACGGAGSWFNSCTIENCECGCEYGDRCVCLETKPEEDFNEDKTEISDDSDS